MEIIKKSLQQLGLTSEEIEVYITTLRLGTATVLQIAQTVDIPRTTVYLLIDSLVAKGLLVQEVQEKKKFFIPESPQKLLQLAQQQKESLTKTISTLQSHLPQLQAVYNLKVDKPKVKYYEGVKEVQAMYDEALNFDKLFMHCISKQVVEVMGDYVEEFFEKIVKNMIHTQEIVADSEEDNAYQKKFSTTRNEIICIPKKYITNTDYIIYGDSVAFITYKNGEPMSVVIEDKEIAHFEKIRFVMIWDMFKNKS